MSARVGTTAPASVSTSGYAGFSEFLEGACGIRLGDGKAYLVESRLRGLMTEVGVDTLDTLVERLCDSRELRLRQRIVDAMTTNETLWFRDEHPFDALRDHMLPALDGPHPPLRVWSAGCSTGQEPYSISMVVEDLCRATFRRLRREVEVVATDLSSSALDLARSGVYQEHALRRGLDATRRRLYFEPASGGLRVAAAVRRRVAFSQLNLLDSYAKLGRFDIVFCRNVLIYFAAERKRDVLERLAGSLLPGGFLVLGGTESVPVEVTGFERLRDLRGLVYRRA